MEGTEPFVQEFPCPSPCGGRQTIPSRGDGFGRVLFESAADHRRQFQGRKRLAQKQEARVKLEFLIDKDLVVTAREEEPDRRLPLPDVLIDLPGAFLRQDGIEQHQVNLVTPAIEHFEGYHAAIEIELHIPEFGSLFWTPLPVAVSEKAATNDNDNNAPPLLFMHPAVRSSTEKDTRTAFRFPQFYPELLSVLTVFIYSQVPEDIWLASPERCIASLASLLETSPDDRAAVTLLCQRIENDVRQMWAQVTAALSELKLFPHPPSLLLQ